MGYDSVDNPAPTADQVANLVLDVVDELLADMNFKETYAGIITIDLTSVNAAFDTLYGFNGIKGLAGGAIAALDLMLFSIHFIIFYKLNMFFSTN